MWRLPVRRLGLKPPIAGGVACEVGGDVAAVNHDVLGMTFPLIVAGARSILHAQWSVDQESTSHLMREVVQAIAKGSDLAEALVIAQRRYVQRAKGLRRLPCYWAAWRVIGKS